MDCIPVIECSRSVPLSQGIFFINTCCIFHVCIFLVKHVLISFEILKRWKVVDFSPMLYCNDIVIFRFVMGTLKQRMWWWQVGTGFSWPTLRVSNLLSSLRTTLLTSTSSLIRLVAGVVTLHLRDSWTPDKQSSCWLEVFRWLVIQTFSQIVMIPVYQIWILHDISREL